jgi:tetratricopeptide (TPR) repeat protein
MSSTAKLTLTLVLGMGMVLPALTDDPTPDEQREQQVAERFQGVLEKSPRRGTALDRLYGYHVERGTLEALIKSFTSRGEKDAKDGMAWMIVGLLEAQRGKDAAAVAALQKAEAARPDDPLASYYLGQSLVLIGQPSAAAEAYERAIARQPNRTDLLDIYQALGRVYQRAQQPEKALAVWARLEAAFPDDLRVQEQIALTLAEEGQFDLALPRYEKLVKAVKDPYRQSTFRIEVAELKVRLKKSPQALADLESLLAELNPDSWLYRDVRRKIDDVFLRNDDQAGLTKYYEEWLKKNPDDLEAMTRLAKGLATQGRMPESKSWLEKAVAKAPSRRDLRQSMIDQLVYEQKYADAIAQYAAMDKADANNPDTLREWGRLLMRDAAKPEAERKSAAAAIWRRLLERRPNDPVVAAQVADLFRAAGISDEAIALYKKAVELAPASAQYREYLGEYLHTLKRSEEALAAWKPIADGANRNAKNLARLAEVLGGFGYIKEAIAVQADAVSLEADDFNLVLKYADLLERNEQHDAALAQLDTATRLAGNDDDRESALLAQIKIYQTTESLTARTEALQKELDAGQDATSDRWHRLARYYEASRTTAEATAAILKALDKDPKSLPVLVTAARLHESGGNMLAAAEVNRKLAAIDRRLRTEYLTKVAQLEARLGRIEAALQAGRDLLAAAPGNPEHYKFFAELCFQIGEGDEGLESLRRSVRANPSDPQGLITLANALAERFRGGEAVELLWRAFEKSPEFDGKLAVVSRLTELYLQSNQFDKLLERLERERREADKQRELTLCIAQAYQAAGDHGTARKELERLLSENARDTQLLGQLATLSENEGDIVSAVKYQRQLEKAAPNSRDVRLKLAQLLVRVGESEEAAGIWVDLVAGEPEPSRNLQAIDQLIGAGKAETALAILSRLAAQKPGDWDLLYREGAALASLEKREDAARRFRAVLDLHVPDDELGAIAKAKKKQKPSRTAGASLRSTNQIEQHPLESRSYAAYTIRGATGLEPRYYYRTQQAGAPPWSPEDFGQARMAAIGWLLAFATRENKQDDFQKSMKAMLEKAGDDPRPRWDWLYLQLVRQNYKDAFDASKSLAAIADPAGAWIFLNSLGNRLVGNQRVVRRSDRPDTTPPLPAAELDQVLQAYRRLKQQKPDWLTSTVVTNVLTELKRAGRKDDEASVYADAVNAAQRPAVMQQVLALAAERGDTKTALEMFDRLEKLPTSIGRSSQVQARQAVDALSKLVQKRADAKAHSEVTQVFDTYLAAQRKLRLSNTQKTSTASTQYGQSQNQVRYMILMPQGYYRQLYIDWPAPNDYYDAGSIQLLRQAYEAFKKDDLVSDLFSSMQKKLDAAPNAEKIEFRLALSYLSWWSQDKEKALTEYQAAAALVPGDTSLRFDLANLRERNNEPDEALAVLDSIQPTDPTVMQKREQGALRLSTRTGNIERARQAADRLFGLRLDAEKQVELASQMHRLGMHAAAENVLARAQRQAGNRTGALVSLMNQYQTQNQADVAVQIARQLLRKGPSMDFRPYRYSGEESDGRGEAIQVLARSGKLNDLIERAEAQLKSSPKSLQLHQALLDYYKAANDKDKIKATMAKMAEIKPDDGKLRFQLAQQFVEMNEHAAACDQYVAALRKEPSLFSYNYWQIIQTFQQAKKTEELTKLFDELDLRTFGGAYYAVMQIVQPLISQDKTREQGLKLFKKAWAAFPETRQYMLSYIDEESIFRLPEIYDYLREAIIPIGDVLPDPWMGTEDISQYGQDGRAIGLFTRVLDVARRQKRLDPLAREVESTLKKFPNWSAGKAFKVVLDAQLGRLDEARTGWQELMDDTKNPMPPIARYIFGQELEDYSSLRPMVLKNYEIGAEEIDKQGNFDLSYSPVRRVILAYMRDDRKEEAKALIRKRAAASTMDYDAGYDAYRKIQNGISAAQLYVQLESPVDALRLYGALLDDSDTFEMAARYYGEDRMRQQVEQSLQQTLRSLKPAILPGAVNELLQPKAERKPGTSAFDLMIVAPERDLNKTVLTSVVGSAVKEAFKKPDLRPAISARTGELAAQFPDDLPTATVTALAALLDDKPDKAAEAVDRLIKLAESQPLEVLPPKTKANSRQRAAAIPQMGLWLAAREAMPREALRPQARKLGERALDAARRQLDSSYALAILREWGQIESEAGEKPAAEARWAQMLELVLPPPPQPKKAPQSTAPAQPTPAPSPPPSAAIGTRTSILAILCLLAPADLIAQVPVPAVGFATVAPSGSAVMSPVATIDQFNQAMQVANLALEQHLPALSLKAVRDCLRGGPPAPAQRQPDDPSGPRRVIYSSAAGGPVEEGSQFAGQVYTSVSGLVARWKREGVPAAEIYAALAAAVLPDGRPAEVFVYPRPLAPTPQTPSESVGVLLARAAVDANLLDDLINRAEARQSQPLGELTARVLLAQAAVAGNDNGRMIALMEWFAQRLQKDTLQSTAELIAHAAAPAVSNSALETPALALLEKAAKNLANAKADARANGALLFLARHQFGKGRVEEGKSLLKQVASAMTKTSGRGTPGSGPGQMQQVAREYIRAGLLADALDLVALVVDLPPNVRRQVPANAVNDTAASLARALATRPAQERYDLLKPWTLPTETRKSVRLLGAFVPVDPPPAIFQAAAPPTSGIVSTADLLIQSAKEAGKLDDLITNLKKAADDKVENAKILLMLAVIASGRDVESEPLVREYVSEIRKRVAKAPEPPPAPTRYYYPGMEGNEPSPQINWPDFLLARACLSVPALGGHGETLCADLTRIAIREKNHNFIQHLRHETASGRFARAELSRDLGLAAWHETSTTSGTTAAITRLPATWVAEDGHVCQVTGPESQYLVFDWPVAGTFRFSVDAFQGAFAQGHVAYSGLVFEPKNAQFTSTVWTIGGGDQSYVPISIPPGDEFQNLTVEVSPGKVRCLVDGRLFYEDADPSPTSPWLALFAARERQAVFRNFKFTGSPTIPREVKLTDRDRLDGWVCPGEVKPQRLRLAQQYDNDVEYDEENGYYRRINRPKVYDWTAKDGVIEGRRLEGTAKEYHPSHLSYFRPLRSGETLSYEFFHQPNEMHVNPCLGRVAFLLEPEGVRLRWLGVKDDDPSGLKRDHAIELTQQRRGKVALKPGEWNTIAIALSDTTASFAINGTVVYEHPLEPSDARTFGLTHDKSKTGAKVRNVVLRGNWPETIDPAILNDLLTRSPGLPTTPAAAAVRRATIGEGNFSKNAQAVLNAAQGLRPGERYERLAAWVMPTGGRTTFQLAGGFTSTDPAPPYASSQPKTRRQIVGGDLEAPALELVKAAKAAGQLDSLAAQIESTSADPRGRLALLALVRSAQGRGADAADALRQLAKLAESLPLDAPIWQRWPDVIAAGDALNDPALFSAATELLEAARKNLERGEAEEISVDGRAAWIERVRQIRGRALAMALANGTPTVFGADPGLTYWTPASELRGYQRLAGRPAAHWVVTDGQVHHFCGDALDYLIFRAPLRGNFEASVELKTEPGKELVLGYGGMRLQIRKDLNGFDLVGFEGKPIPGKIDPPLAKTGDWLPVRLVVKDGAWSITVGDRKLCEEPLPSYADPWLWLGSNGGNTGAARNLVITGAPTILESVFLSQPPDLTAWRWYFRGPKADTAPVYRRYVEDGSESNGPWVKRGEEITATGARPEPPAPGKPAPPRTWSESALFFHRPMAEDGAIEYEFYYQPEKMLVHPALDRLCLLLEPKGVRVHWLTDGGQGRHRFEPENMQDEPANRRGPSDLPLKPKEWNKVRLEIKGDTLVLALNGVIVYERAIENSNQRTFGFFHYTDDTSVRVRNVVYRGAWPKSMPAPSELFSVSRP